MCIRDSGNGDDTKLYHNDTDFYLDNKKGHINIRNNETNDDSNIYIQARDGEDSIICEDDASVKLYWAGTSAGVRVTTTQAGVTIGGVLSGNGSGLTDLNASNLTTGTISADRLPGSMGGNSASASTVNIDQDNSGANRQVLFVPANSTGNVSPLIDSDTGNFFYNPNTATLGGLSSVESTNFTSSGTIGATNINASGTVNLNGAVNIGNATSDLVTITAAVDSSINPDSTSNNRDLGNSVQKWRNVYGVNFLGNGSSVTHLNLGQSSNTGTIPTARLGSGTANSGTFLAGDQTYKAIDLTNLNASNLTSGTVPVARLGSSGTRNGSNFLAGDNSWKTINTNLINDTTPQLGGHLDVNAKNINFSDSGTFGTDDTLRFGASNDFNIFHGSGSNTVTTYRNKNIIKTQGSNPNLLVELGSGTHNAGFTFTERGAGNNLRTIMSGGWYGNVQIYYQGNKIYETTSVGGKITGKLETTSTGVTITGDLSVTGSAGGLVDSRLTTSTATSNQILSWTGTAYDWVDPPASGGSPGGSNTQLPVSYTHLTLPTKRIV